MRKQTVLIPCPIRVNGHRDGGKRVRKGFAFGEARTLNLRVDDAFTLVTARGTGDRGIVASIARFEGGELIGGMDAEVFRRRGKTGLV